MTVKYTDYEISCTLTLVKNENGFLTAVWDYGDEDGSTYINTAVCFGENYLAICESGEPNSDYFGVAVVIDDYLVIAISSFLSVYTASGNDWHGVLVDYSKDVVTNENLTYT